MVLGLLMHRDGVIPLISLAALLGAPQHADLSTSCVLLINGGTASIGLVVDGLGAIERSVWEEQDDEPNRGLPSDPLARALAGKRTIRTSPVGATGAERMLPRLDLTAIAEAVSAGSWR